MIGYNKKTCVKFNEIKSDKKLVFELCDKLKKNRIHIQQDKVFTLFDDEKDLSCEYLAFLIEKLLFHSHPNTKDLDADALVDKYFDWFCYELNSRVCLVDMLGGDI